MPPSPEVDDICCLVWREEIGRQLDEDFGIMCRVGLHCAPAAHKTIGTFPSGTVRLGLGALNTLDEIDVFINAIDKITE